MSDKTTEREVSRDEGATLARYFGCAFLETSAKTSHNVDMAFMNLVTRLRDEQQRGMSGGSQSRRDKQSKNCVIV